MKPDRWQQIDQIFARALDLPPGERAGYLDQTCEGDAALRREVDRLLAADDAASSFLETPILERTHPFGPGVQGAVGETEVRPGRRIGPYRLLEIISKGGMGTVYRAQRDDAEFEREVAIKLIRRGLNSPEIIERFRIERQILARLDHPNIARLYDGGTTERGQPYLVMEMVEGLPIDEYLDRRHAPIEERLALFCQACEAVTYAHRNLLVHRDIKPSNLLVTEAGELKLLDFGIAKLLDPDGSSSADATRTGQRMMTPGYASPEQVRGEPVTTASDVYSLGVLLHRLLTGCRPYPLTGTLPHELELAILEREPVKPSLALGSIDRLKAPGEEPTSTPEQIASARGGRPKELVRRLRGDLDTIVLEAMHKEPERRYDSVDRLADDIRRHLSSLPVHARPASVAYRARRFVRRHWIGVGAAACIALLLVGFSAALFSQAQRTARERDKAEVVSSYIIDIFKLLRPDDPLAASVSSREVLAEGAKRVALELRDQPDVQATLLDTIGTIYHQMGLFPEARELIEQGLALRRDLYGRRHGDIALSLGNLAAVHEATGDLEGGRELYDQGLDMLDRLGEEDGRLYAQLLTNQAHNYWSGGEYDEAEWRLRAALDLRRQLDSEPNRPVVVSLTTLGALLAETGSIDEAKIWLTEALELQHEVYGEEHPDEALVLETLARIDYRNGDYTSAVDRLRDAVDMLQRFHGEENPEVLRVTAQLGRTLEAGGQWEEAEAVFRRALDLDLEIYGALHNETATTRNNLAVLLSNMGRYEEALVQFERVLEIRREVLGEQHPYVMQTYYSKGQAHHALGEYDAAERLYRLSEEGTARLLPEDHPALAYPPAALAVLALDRSGDDRDQLAEAERLLRASITQLGKGHPEDHWRLATQRSALGECLARQGRIAEAESLLTESLEQIVAQRGERDPRARQATERLAALREAEGP